MPASMPVLQELGVLSQVEDAGFPKKWGATMLWGREPDPWTWRFSETNRTYPHAYQVWRPTFDKILLDNARTAGVDVREGHTVTSVEVVGDRVSALTYRTEEGSTATVEAGWVVDASGQSAVLGRALGLREWDDRFRNMAIYAYFHGSDRLAQPDHNNIFIESYEHGWVWNIPLRDHFSSVGVVVDAAQGQIGIARHGVDGFFRRQLNLADHNRSMLTTARMTRPPRVAKDWSYKSSRSAGDGWILVGDAACFIDPLFSSGVHLAMMSAMMAAAYIDAASNDPSIRVPASRTYQDLYHTEYSHFRELAKLFYASNRTAESYFWEARRLLGAQEEEGARDAFIRTVAGQAPRGYERAVLDRGDLPPGIRSAINDLETEREQRASQFNIDPSLDAVPELTHGVGIDRKPIFVVGEFQWSDVLISPGRPDGLPISSFVAAMLHQIDGNRTLREIGQRIGHTAPSRGERETAIQTILAATRLLLVDGVVVFRLGRDGS